LKKIWSFYTQGSINRKIFSATATIFAMTLFINGVSICKELVVAWKFGTKDALDAFLIAFLLPFFVTGIVASSFNAALIPTYIRVREKEGNQAAQRLLSSFMVWSFIVLIVVTILMIVTAPLYLPFIASGFNTEKLNLTRRILYILAPIVVVSGFGAIWRAILNAHEKFALAALTPVFIPITIIVFLFAFGERWGIFAIAFGTMLGALIEITILGRGLKLQGIQIHPTWHGFDRHMRKAASQYSTMIIGTLLMSSTVLVDQAMAAMLEPGSVAALNYGHKVIAFPIGLTGMALGTAIIPFFSKMVAHENWLEIRHILYRYMRLALIITVPLAILFSLISEPMIRILFQRGSFSVHDTSIVARVQFFYAFQIPFFVSGILFVRLISSMRKNNILAWGALINVIANVILNYILMKKIGVAGIALSTSLVYLLSFLFVFYNAERLLRKYS
jgi:putative peptidoglycan lipid II flippase